MRTVKAVLKALLGHLHRGFAFGRRDMHLDAVLEAAAGVLQEAEASAAALMDETDPRRAYRLLPDYERVLGPDRCGRDRASLTLAERQALAHQRWTAMGGQSIPYFLSIAANLGVPIEIKEYWPSKTGRFRCGQRLVPGGTQFVWIVKLAPVVVRKFRVGKSTAAHRLGAFQASLIECEFRRIRPAHTHIVFSYTLGS